MDGTRGGEGGDGRGGGGGDGQRVSFDPEDEHEDRSGILGNTNQAIRGRGSSSGSVRAAGDARGQVPLASREQLILPPSSIHRLAGNVYVRSTGSNALHGDAGATGEHIETNTETEAVTETDGGGGWVARESLEFNSFCSAVEAGGSTGVMSARLPFGGVEKDCSPRKEARVRSMDATGGCRGGSTSLGVPVLYSLPEPTAGNAEAPVCATGQDALHGSATEDLDTRPSFLLMGMRAGLDVRPVHGTREQPDAIRWGHSAVGVAPRKVPDDWIDEAAQRTATSPWGGDPLYLPLDDPSLHEAADVLGAFRSEHPLIAAYETKYRTELARRARWRRANRHRLPQDDATPIDSVGLPPLVGSAAMPVDIPSVEEGLRDPGAWVGLQEWPKPPGGRKAGTGGRAWVYESESA